MKSQAEQIAEQIERKIAGLQVRNVPKLRALRREVSNELRTCPPEMILKIAYALLSKPSISTRFIAYEIIANHKPALAKVGEKELKRLGQGIDSWGAVDMFGCYLSGPAWRAGQASDQLIHTWARSKDRWWRRAALVSTVPLNLKARGGAGDTNRTLAVCRLLVGDRDDMVVKALSWALRALVRTDARSVEQFVNDHRQELPPLVVREVRNKLKTGLKNPRKS